MSDVPSPSAAPPEETPRPGDDPLVGRVVGNRWRVLRRLGQGGMGAIYEGQNVAIGKRVALKFIQNWGESAEACLRFQREAEAASAVESAHIIHVFDTGATEEGQPYLVMELLQGESLGARLRRGQRLSVAEAVQITAQILRGLGRAHEAGVVHRDLKPDNVFLVRQDDGVPLVKILDFGISKIARSTGAGPSTITREGTVLGTPYYMSPEQAQALPGLDGRSDLFSVGVILFECLVGRSPWAALASYEAVIVAICSRDAPDVRLFTPEVPAPLAEVVKVALTREPTGRFPSAQAFLAALQQATPGLLSQRNEALAATALAEPVQPRDDNPTWTPREPLPSVPVAGPARRPALLWPGIAATLFAFAGTWIALHARPAPPPPAVRPPPEVTMEVEVLPDHARVLVDGRPLEGQPIRGPALSEVELRAEAEGHAPLVRRVLLDGRRVLHLALDPLPGASASASPLEAPEPPRPPASVSRTLPPRPLLSASPAASGSGLRLKDKL